MSSPASSSVTIERWKELEHRRVVVREHGEDTRRDEIASGGHAVAFVGELQPHEQPAPSELERQIGECLLEPLAEVLHPLVEAGRLDRVEHRQCGQAAQLGPAEGRDVDERVLVEERVHLRGHERGRDRVDPARETLAGRHQIGLDALLRSSSHVDPAAAEAGLDLVERRAARPARGTASVLPSR